MKFEDIQQGKEYTLTHAYDKPDQRVLITRKESDKVRIQYTSNDSTMGMCSFLNVYEAERYLR